MADLTHFLHWLKILKKTRLKKFIKSSAYEIAKPVAEIITNLLKGNLESVNIERLRRYQNLLRDIYAVRHSRVKVAEILEKEAQAIEQILLIIRPAVLKKCANLPSLMSGKKQYESSIV